jgi:hypothetical protein
LQEVRNGKGELVKKPDLELLEERGSHPGKKCFQVSARAFEPKPAKVGKGDVSRDWSVKQFPLNVTGGNREQGSEM